MVTAMDELVIDMESYYDKDFSLSKMQTDAYITDDRYQTIGVAVKRNDEPTVWFTGSEADTAAFLYSFDPNNCMIVCHHTLFDGFILSQRFGIKPKLWADTLGMARALHPYRTKFSLASLSHDLLGAEKGTEVLQAIGKYRADFTPADLAHYGEYCRNDVELTYGLHQLFRQGFPALEYNILDMVIRMFTEPKLVGDIPAMQALYEGEVARKEALLALAEVDKELIMSNDKMAEALRALGVSPPLKMSARTSKVSYAFAKTDKEFVELLEHPDSDVQNLVAARLGVKTTIAETRAYTMWQSAMRGPLPVYLNYWGAKTTGRLSGGNKINYQNLPARGPSAGIRNAIMAPEGHSIVVGDSSNIELRVAMAMAGETEVLAKIAAGVDMYCDFASVLFDKLVTKADKMERMLGKIAMLSLQYGAGWVKFQEMVRLQSGMALSDDEAKRIVYLYRNTFSKIIDLWEHCGDVVLPDIANGGNLIAVDVNAWVLTTPTGFTVPGYPGVYYKNLKYTDGEWFYEMGATKVKLYGGKVVENLSQYVARNIVMWQTAKHNRKYPVALSVHDEMVSVVLDADVSACEEYMLKCLQQAPSWCAGAIPLTGEVGHGKSYGESK